MNDTTRSSGTLHRIDDHDQLRFERRLAHPVPRVWASLTDPAQTARWLAPDSLGIRDRPEQAVVEPQKMLQYVWRGDVIRWELTPDGDGTVLVLTHLYERPGDPPRLAAGWHTHLGQLDLVLDGQPAPWSADRWMELDQEYVRAFPEHGRLYRFEGRERVGFDRWLAHPAEKIWAALTDNDQLRHWFPAQIEGDLAIDATVRLVSPNDEFPPAEGEILELDPPHALAYTWGLDVLRWEIWDFGGHCRLVFTHDVVDDEDLLLRSMAGWHVGFDLLDSLLAGAPAGRSADREADLRRDYDRLYATTLASRKPDTSTLRLERRLEQPPATVWSALTEPDQLREWLTPAEIDLEPAAGGRVRITYRGYDDEPLAGYVHVADPAHRLSYDWGEDTVHWELAPDGEGTRLTFVDVLRHPADLGCAAGWSNHHEQLAALLTTGTTDRPKATPGRLSTTDDRPAVHFERWLPHPPAKVWAAITEPDQLARWFPAEISGERAPDADLRFAFPGAEAPTKLGKVLQYDPVTVFAFTWGEDELRFELEPEAGGCCLYFSNAFQASQEQTLKNAAGWHGCLDHLEAALSGGATPAPDAWKELYIGYARQL